MLKAITMFDVYYYDEMLISQPDIKYQSYFNKAEAEHFINHIHLKDYLDYGKVTKEDCRDIANLLFYRLKGMYPKVKFVVYLVFDADDMPILDFGAIREGELIYYDLNSKKAEYYINDPRLHS